MLLKKPTTTTTTTTTTEKTFGSFGYKEEEEAFLLRQKGKEEGFVEAATDVLTTIRLYIYIIEALKNNIVATVLAIPTG
jgi:hypothetical protein